MLLYPISSKSPQSDLDNKATLPGVRDPESDPNDETQSDTTETAFSGYTITLDAGHGGYDPGKIGINDSKEKDINLQIASYLQELLDSLGFEVYMTRTDDSSLNTETAESLKTSDLNHRIEIVTSHNSDFFISIHQNSFSDSSVHGAQVFYYANSFQTPTDFLYVFLLLKRRLITIRTRAKTAIRPVHIWNHCQPVGSFITLGGSSFTSSEVSFLIRTSSSVSRITCRARLSQVAVTSMLSPDIRVTFTVA